MVKRTVFRAILIITAIFTFALVGCEQEGPAEKMGKSVDEAIEKTQESMQEAGDSVNEAVEEGAEKVEEAAENAQ